MSYFRIGYVYSFRCGLSHVVGRVLAIDPMGVVVGDATKYDSVGTLESTFDAIRSARDPFAVAGNRLPPGTLVPYLALNNGFVAPLLTAQNEPVTTWEMVAAEAQELGVGM